MPCCTLIALLFSQPALVYGAIKTRLFARPSAAAPAVARDWRILGLMALGIAELLIASTGALAVSTTHPLLLREAVCGFAR